MKSGVVVHAISIMCYNCPDPYINSILFDNITVYGCKQLNKVAMLLICHIDALQIGLCYFLILCRKTFAFL